MNIKPSKLISVSLKSVKLNLPPCQRDAISHLTIRISKMWVLLKDLGHRNTSHEGTLSLVLKAHLESETLRRKTIQGCFAILSL